MRGSTPVADNAGRARSRPRETGRRRPHESRMFVMFATVAMAVSFGNIFHYHMAHDEGADVTALKNFLATHFRTERRTEDVAQGADVSDGSDVSSVSTDHHEVSGLSCSKFGGPSDEAASEMIYWSDIPSDSKHTSPFLPGPGEDEKFVTFEPDHGGWNNIRMAMETVLVLAHAMGRTLVLPPEQKMYLLNQGGAEHKKHFSFSDFFHLESIAAEHDGFKVITMEEFLRREGMKDRLIDKKSGKPLAPPNDQVDWNSLGFEPLWEYLRTVGEVPIWNPSECIAGIPKSSDPDDVKKLNETLQDLSTEKYRPRPTIDEFVGKPTPVDGSTMDRMAEALGERPDICLYTSELQQARHIHFMVEHKTHTRLLTHFYSFIFFQDWRQVSPLCLVLIG